MYTGASNYGQKWNVVEKLGGRKWQVPLHTEKPPFFKVRFPLQIDFFLWTIDRDVGITSTD